MVDDFSSDKTQEHHDASAIQTITDLIQAFPNDPWAHDVFCAMATGQDYAQESYQLSQQLHGISLSQTQCPSYAYSGDMHPCGHESFFVGPSKLGDCLVVRTPGAIWLDENGELNTNTRALFALARSKNIKYLFHAKTTASWVIRDIERYFSSTDVERHVDDFALHAFIEPRRKLYDVAVMQNGRAYYERMGIVFEPEETPEAVSRNNVLAMTAQQLMWDIEAGRKEKDPRIVPLLQDAANKRHYVWNPVKKTFTALMPMRHELSSISEEQARQHSRVMQLFLRQMPVDRSDPKSANEWKQIAAMLMTGYSEYLNDSEILKSLGKNHGRLIVWAGCADSRLKLKAVLGKAITRLLQPTLRLVGGILTTPEGTLSEPARLAALYALKKDLPFVHSHHSRCGAMAAIRTYCSDPEGVGKTMPEAFQRLGQDNMWLYQNVGARGQTSQDVIESYHKETGIRGTETDDCQGLELLKIDRAALLGELPGLKTLSAYVDVASCQINVRAPNSSRMLPVRAVGRRHTVSAASQNPVAAPPQGSAMRCGLHL